MELGFSNANSKHVTHKLLYYGRQSVLLLYLGRPLARFGNRAVFELQYQSQHGANCYNDQPNPHCGRPFQLQLGISGNLGYSVFILLPKHKNHLFIAMVISIDPSLPVHITFALSIVGNGCNAI